MGTLLEEAQILNPNGMVELFKIDFTTRLATGGSGPSIVYYTNENGTVTYDGQSYSNTSIEFIPAAIEHSNAVPKSRLMIWGQETDVLDAINSYGKIKGTTITYTLTHIKFLDDGTDPQPTQNIAETYFVESILELNKSKIEIEITPALGLDKVTEPALRTIV